MDDRKYTLDELLAWTHAVKQQLQKAIQSEAAPKLDIQWLLLRCQDTLAGHAARESAMQLLNDVAQFQTEFPGILQVPKPGEAQANPTH